MQKIDFIKNLEVIIYKMSSESIVNLFVDSMRSQNTAYNYTALIPTLFTSKSNYEQIKNIEGINDILVNISAETIYSETNLTQLTGLLRTGTPPQILSNPQALSFYNFHKVLLDTYRLSKKVLLGEVLSHDLEENLNSGVIVFQILIDSEGLETEKYIKIFTALNDLIETISEVVNESQNKSEIILLDSGSDTNLALKAGIETAKSVFQIFKEIWDFIVNFRFYKQKERNKSLMESLTIREEILKKVAAGVLTEEEGKKYIHLVKTRTDDLIGMKVMPKQIVVETNELQNRKLLEEFEGTKLLGNVES